MKKVLKTLLFQWYTDKLEYLIKITTKELTIKNTITQKNYENLEKVITTLVILVESCDL